MGNIEKLRETLNKQIPDAIAFMTPRTREAIIQQLGISVIKDEIGVKQMRAREMGLESWIQLSESYGFDYIEDFLKYIRRSQDIVTAFARVRNNIGDSDSLIAYMLENKEIFNRRCYNLYGETLGEYLINKLSNNFKRSGSIGNKNFIRTRGGRVIASFVLGYRVKKQDETKAINQLKSMILSDAKNNLEDYLTENNINSGLEIIAMGDDHRKRIGYSIINKILGVSVRPRDFTTKYKILFAERLGYDINKEIANMLIKNGGNIVSGFGRLSQIFGKYTIQYVLERKDSIDSCLIRATGKSLRQHALIYAAHNDFELNIKNYGTNIGKILLCLYLGDNIKQSDNDLKTYCFRFNESASFYKK